mgnify:CR=1 FL=1
MSDESTLNMLSENEKLRFCPDMGQCPIFATYSFFERICNTPNYINCIHYCKKHNIVYTPFDWLKKKAIKTDERKRRRRRLI